jgi:hypothetical protein
MSEKCIKLHIPDNIINCFGIQPSFQKSEICERISLFSLYRYTKWAGDNAKTNNVYYEPALYKGKDAQIFYNLATPAFNLERKAIKLFWENATHLSINFQLENLQEDKNKLRDILLYYSELIKYWNRLNRGNFFITSDEIIFNNIGFAFKQLQKYDKYKVNENILPKNIIIIGAKGMTSFDNPIIASPFIDEIDYKNFLNKNKLSNFYQLDMKKRFPIMEKMNHLYDNYQLYINEKMPQKWHFEIFSNTKYYYIILHLN